MYYKDNKLYTESEIKELYPNTSFSIPFNPQELGFEVVFNTPMPEVTDLQVAVIDGTEIDSKNNRVIKYRIENKFATKEEEDLYLAQKADEQKQIAKEDALKKIADLEMQALRPMRAILAGTASQFDTQKLADIEAEILTLRGVLNG